MTNKESITNLYGEALARLRQTWRNTEITPEAIATMITTTHAPSCSNWKGIETSCLEHYIVYLITALHVQNFNCEFIGLLHEYCNVSKKHLPTNTQQLVTFHVRGTIPTRNLHLLRTQLLATESSCAMCHNQIASHTPVYKLSCGHVFCDRRDSQCNLPGFLANAGRCPHCACTIQFDYKPQ